MTQPDMPASPQLAAADTAYSVLDHDTPIGMEALRAEVDAERQGVQPGWYTEPGGDPSQRRYWDGDTWAGPPVPAALPAPDGPPPEPIPAGSVEVSLCGKTVYVLPRPQWRSSAVSALNRGDFDMWAQACLARDADFDLWLQLDPMIEEIGSFFDSWGEATGQNSGKSRGSKASFVTIRRR